VSLVSPGLYFDMLTIDLFKGSKTFARFTSFPKVETPSSTCLLLKQTSFYFPAKTMQ